MLKSWLDRIMGRGKQAAGDVTGNRRTWEKGVHQEAEGEAEERAAAAEATARTERERAAEHRVERED